MAVDRTSPEAETPLTDDPDDSLLAERVLRGDRKAVARLISLLEDEDPAAEGQLGLIASRAGKAHVVGITGPAGSGKSTLVWKLIEEFRGRGRGVGVVAVDPTSPFTGGAVLGDRVRMRQPTADPGVFIRSMASRGAVGGLAGATSDVVKVLDAYGSDVIFVETAGVGQDEVDVARMAHTTVVLQVPGMGDEVQAIKAGILEIGDVFVVNKADRAMADTAVSELRMVLGMAERASGWNPPVLKTVATRGQGIVELADALEAHLSYLRSSGELAERLEETAEFELVAALERRFIDELLAAQRVDFEAMLKEVAARRLDARAAARQLVAAFRSG